MAHMVKSLPAMLEAWVQSLGQEDPLEKEMATHSSILAWKIPWTEGPGWLQSRDPIPDPRRPASPRPGRAPGALPTFTTGSR